LHGRHTRYGEHRREHAAAEKGLADAHALRRKQPAARIGQRLTDGGPHGVGQARRIDREADFELRRDRLRGLDIYGQRRSASPLSFASTFA
jgi:hypothetical protein